MRPLREKSVSFRSFILVKKVKCVCVSSFVSVGGEFEVCIAPLVRALRGVGWSALELLALLVQTYKLRRR